MDNRELEKKIANAFANIAPDTLDSVLQACDEQKGRVIVMTEKKKKNSFVRSIAGIAAAFVLVFGGIMGLNVYRGNQAIASTVMLDVNPSIEIQVNKNEKVLGVNALNEDAKEVIGTMDFSGSSLEVTVNALIGSMLRNGYISDAANSILVTVDSNNPAVGAELQNKLMAEISALLESGNNSVALLGQTITADKDITKLAEEYGITAGKAKLIAQIVAENPTYVFADLVPMTINELNLLSESRNISLGNIETVGKASDASYIGESAAKTAALTHAGVDAASVTHIKCELDWEKGIMVYEVEFDANGFEYDYDINATTGAVVKHSKEVDDDYRPSTPQSSPQGSTQGAASGSSSTPTGSSTASGSSSSGAATYIGEASAKSKALAHAGVSASSIWDYECGLDYENGVAVYEISFKTNGYEYDYDINATTGAVVKHSKEVDDDYRPSAPQSSTQSSTQGAASGSSSAPAGSGAATGSSGSGAASYIGEASAKSKALAHAGVSAGSIWDYECGLDYENGVAVYEIGFKTNGFEYDYDINATTGEVVKHSKEADDDYRPSAPQSSTQSSTQGAASGSSSAPAGSGASTGSSGSGAATYIGEASAKSKALAHAGVSADSIWDYECGLDYENGVAVYEINFKTNGYEYNYDINATTGAVVKWEKEID